MNIAVYRGGFSKGHFICRFIHGKVRCIILSPRKLSDIPDDLLKNVPEKESINMYVDYHYDSYRLRFDTDVDGEYCYCNGEAREDGCIYLRITRRSDKKVIAHLHLNRVGDYRIHKNRDYVYPPPKRSENPPATSGIHNRPETSAQPSRTQKPASPPRPANTQAPATQPPLQVVKPVPPKPQAWPEPALPGSKQLSDTTLKWLLYLVMVILLMGCATCICQKRTGCHCADGTRSDATGSGACSHHGGVKHWHYKYWWDK